MIYCGVPANQWASSGAAIAIRKDWKHKIQNYTWISDRIIETRIKALNRNFLVGKWEIKFCIRVTWLKNTIRGSVTNGVWTRFICIRVVVGCFEHGSVATFGFHSRREFRESWANVTCIVYCVLVGDDSRQVGLLPDCRVALLMGAKCESVTAGEML